MFINNIHILFYLFVGLFGCIEGQLIGLINKRICTLLWNNDNDVYIEYCFTNGLQS